MSISLEGEIKVNTPGEEEYQFIVSFSNDKISNIRMDEPQPLGNGKYPNAGSLLAAAVGNCLCSSLLLGLDKLCQMWMGCRLRYRRRWSGTSWDLPRIKKMNVRISPDVENNEKFRRCREIFEDFCIVTQSVKGRYRHNGGRHPIRSIRKKVISSVCIE